MISVHKLLLFLNREETFRIQFSCLITEIRSQILEENLLCQHTEYEC